jgi:division protein CdvB (Snf7/Vps24/ESCRT-III family)
MVERLGNLEKGFSSLQKIQKDDNERIVATVNTLTNVMKVWMEETQDMENLRIRLERIEKHIGDNYTA